MAYLCKRCYINSKELTKKEIKQLVVTDMDFMCDGCGKAKKLVLERKPKTEEYNDEED